jgi:hypothetical protein
MAPEVDHCWDHLHNSTAEDNSCQLRAELTATATAGQHCLDLIKSDDNPRLVVQTGSRCTAAIHDIVTHISALLRFLTARTRHAANATNTAVLGAPLCTLQEVCTSRNR